jgi:hypothetical protein
MARNGRRYRKSFQQRSLESPLRVVSGRFELAAQDDLITGNLSYIFEVKKARLQTHGGSPAASNPDHGSSHRWEANYKLQQISNAAQACSIEVTRAVNMLTRFKKGWL